MDGLSEVQRLLARVACGREDGREQLRGAFTPTAAVSRITEMGANTQKWVFAGGEVALVRSDQDRGSTEYPHGVRVHHRYGRYAKPL